MSDLFSKKIPTTYNVKKYDYTQLQDPVLYASNKDRSYEYVILLENFVTDKELRLFQRFFFAECEKVLDHKPSILILSIVPMESDMKSIKNVTRFYESNMINLTEYVKPHSQMLVVGRSLSALTSGDITNTSTFYDYIFNNTHIYVPFLQSYAYPVDPFYKWITKNGSPSYRILDTWETFFAGKQITKLCRNIPFERKVSAPQHVVHHGDINSFYEQYANEERIAVDTETNSLDFCKAKIGCVSLSFDGKTGHVIPWEHIDPVAFGSFIADKFQIYQNGKYDIKVLWKNGVPRKDMHIDCEVWNQGHVTNEMRSNSLKALAWHYTSYGGYDKPLDEYKKRHKIQNYLKIPPSVLYPYAAMDAIITYQCSQQMNKQIRYIDKKLNQVSKRWNLWKYYYDIVIPTLNNFVDVEYHGAYINIDALYDEQKRLIAEVDRAIDEIWHNNKLGFSSIGSREKLIDILNSSKQLGEFIEKRGYPSIQVGKVGYYLTGDGEIDEWIKQGYEEMTLLRTYRKLSKLLNSFVGTDEESGMFRFLKKHEDGSYTIHSDFFVMLMKSHRFASQNPNLQQVPKHSEESRRIRKFYCPPSDDYYFAEFDAAGFQLRIGAALSGDEAMKDVFVNKGGDLHSMTAASVLKRDVSVDEFIARKKEPEFDAARFRAKGINFAMEFGSSSYAFARNVLHHEWSHDDVCEYIQENKLQQSKERLQKLDIELAIDSQEFFDYWTVAVDIRKKFFERYSGLQYWVDSVPELAVKQGYVVSPFGAIRRLPELIHFGKDNKRRNRHHYKNLRNQSLNSPVQNFEVVLIAQLWNGLAQYIREQSLKSRLVITVHD